jgi:hypothetical protein
VHVRAPGNTGFDFYIKNQSGLKCFQRQEVVQEFASDCETPVPAGEYTAYIDNAELAGEYECELIFSEVY